MMGKPQFTVKDAERFANEHYGIMATAQPLASERDQNFLLLTRREPTHVLKIANATEERGCLEAQNAVLRYLAGQESALQYPGIVSSIDGSTMVQVSGGEGAIHEVRVLTYVPGHRLRQARPYTRELLESLGRGFGRLDRALQDFTHPALRRSLVWDLREAGSVVSANAGHVPDPSRRALMARHLQRFQKEVEPSLSALRTSVIHNDGNDDNVLVTNLHTHGGSVTGLIDFGDLLETTTIGELAICSAYAVLQATDPLSTVAHLVRGYHREFPVTEQELEVLYDLMVMRLCTSAVLSARRKEEVCRDPYLAVSEHAAWTALEQLSHIHPRLWLYVCREACGWPPCPASIRVTDWLKEHPETVGPVVHYPVRSGEVLVFDRRPDSPEFPDVPEATDTLRATQALFDRMRTAGVKVGIGRYDEPNRAYTSTAYRGMSPAIEEWRTIHLGMDLFMEPGSEILVPLDATVHSFRNNDRPQDYGPTVILQHELQGIGRFFTLYGHLSAESLVSLDLGTFLPKGSRLGTVGESSINGGWPPHLHLQLIMDLLDYEGDFPGVCAASQRAVWRSLCPSPNLLLQIPGVEERAHAHGFEDLLERRRRHIGPSLHLSYDHPLMLVRGWRQFVYDHLGRAYLDAVNNVCHVGHAHPVVVEAASRQMALLNTNTRYLHAGMVELAERLSATLPGSLSVWYFVCSGSEANELALRLARAHTGGTEFLVIEGGYHGNTSSLVDVSSYKFDGPGGRGAPAHVHTVPLPDCFRGPFKEPDTAGLQYAGQVRSVLERLTPRRLAAFLGESLPSCAGQIVLPPGYLREVYRLVREAGGVCIADEVQVGFGRVGTHFWGFETQGAVPDIVTMGKPMGNGHPLAAIVTTPAIAASFASGMEYFNTFGGNPVSCAVGLAVLEVLQRERLQEQALTVGAYLKARLARLMEEYPLIGDVRGLGLFLGLELVRDPSTLEPADAEAAYVAERMKEQGILLSTDGKFRNVLKIKPPMVFTKDDADRLVHALQNVLAEPRLEALGREMNARQG